ncbi:MAG TPA: (Fe-S)-binding protein [Burkholderiales bacterium]|nr:(Fe-S)-binding protein [Burkholderiales bacterium]
MKLDDLPSQHALVQIADRCVACGLCLPHCPTYRKTLSEADSPRGRIQLMKGVLESRIPPNKRFVEHIDLCLTCRACERVCPNSVAYGQLVDGAREFIETLRRGNRIDRWMRRFVFDGLIAKPLRLEKLAAVLRFYQRSGLQRLVRRIGLLRWIQLDEFERHLPLVQRGFDWRENYPATRSAKGEVALFLGCVARIMDNTTLKAAVYVLNRLGYTVRVPKNQTCCGALHQHSGDALAAKQLAAQNLNAFPLADLDAIICTASGCGATLTEYHLMLGKDAKPFSSKVADFSEFLGRVEDWSAVPVQPFQEKIAVHDPCTLRNVMRQEQAPYALLRRIPKAQIVALAGNDQCCGAAGTYFLSQPEMAQRLIADKIEAVREGAVQWLATSNPGCAMHFAEALRKNGLEVKIAHPATIVARQMGFNEDDS